MIEIVNKRGQIEEIMIAFDFLKVKNVMKFLGWTWGADEESPSIEELKETAKRLLNGLGIESKNGICMTTSTGGFRASLKKNEFGCYNLGLSFDIEEAETL